MKALKLIIVVIDLKFEAELIILGGGITPKKKTTQAKIPKLTSNPKAKEDSLKLKEVQDKIGEANQFLSDNSSEFVNNIF